MSRTMIKTVLMAAGTALTVVAFSSAVMADVKNTTRGTPVLKCTWITVTECTQTQAGGPTTCETHKEKDCEVVGGVGSLPKQG